MDKITFYIFCYVALIVIVWSLLGRGSALFCFFVGLISFLGVFVEQRFGSVIAALFSCVLIIAIPITIWLFNRDRPTKP